MPGSFLRYGVGARSQALGGTGVISSRDSTAVYWNPALLRTLSKGELGAYYSMLWEDTSHSFLGIAYPLKIGTFGFGYVLQQSGGFIKIDSPSDEPEEFSISKNAMFFSYAYGPVKGLTMGASFKTVNTSIDIYSSSGYGADMGCMLDLGSDLSVGISLRNILSPKITLRSTDEEFALQPVLGAMYTIQGFLGTQCDLLSFVAEFAGGSEKRINTGLEYSQAELISFRLGYGASGVTAGAGLCYRKNYRLDYAIVLHELDPTHHLFLNVRFGYSITELEQMRKKSDVFTKKDALRRSEEYEREGIKLYNQGDLAQTIVMWERALIWRPDNVSLEKRLEEVRAQLEELSSKRMLENRISNAYRSYQEGDMIGSLDEWREIVKIDPDNLRAREYIKKIEGRLSDIEKEKYRKSLRSRQSNRYNNLLASSEESVKKKRYAQALKELAQARSIFPEDNGLELRIKGVEQSLRAEVSKNMSQGRAFFDEGKYLKAIESFNNVLQLQPENTEASEYIDRSREGARQAVKVNQKDTERLYYKAADLYLKGDYREAIDELNKILELNPGDENAFKLLEKARSVLEVIE